MENLKLIEETLRLIGIHDNMILSDTINISGDFVARDDGLLRADRIKVIVDFEIQLGNLKDIKSN